MKFKILIISLLFLLLLNNCSSFSEAGKVLRNEKVIIPRSNYVFQKEDRVVFLAKKDSISVVENLFRISSV